jgi:hypothetical protein
MCAQARPDQAQTVLRRIQRRLRRFQEGMPQEVPGEMRHARTSLDVHALERRPSAANHAADQRVEERSTLPSIRVPRRRKKRRRRDVPDGSLDPRGRGVRGWSRGQRRHPSPSYISHHLSSPARLADQPCVAVRSPRRPGRPGLRRSPTCSGAARPGLRRGRRHERDRGSSLLLTVYRPFQADGGAWRCAFSLDPAGPALVRYGVG